MDRHTNYRSEGLSLSVSSRAFDRVRLDTLARWEQPREGIRTMLTECSVHKAWEVVCTICGASSTDYAYATKTKAVKEFIAQGWVETDGNVFCPGCAFMAGADPLRLDTLAKETTKKEMRTMLSYNEKENLHRIIGDRGWNVARHFEDVADSLDVATTKTYWILDREEHNREKLTFTDLRELYGYILGYDGALDDAFAKNFMKNQA